MTICACGYHNPGPLHAAECPKKLTEYTPDERLRHNVVVTIRNIGNWPATMTQARIQKDLMDALQGKTLEELT